MQFRPCVIVLTQKQLLLSFLWVLEDNFWGVIDLVTMTAWDFKADDKGMTYPEPMDEIPAEFKEDAEIYHQGTSRSSS